MGWGTALVWLSRVLLGYKAVNLKKKKKKPIIDFFFVCQTSVQDLFCDSALNVGLKW